LIVFYTIQLCGTIPADFALESNNHPKQGGNMKKLVKGLGATLLLIVSGVSQATLVTSISGGSVVDFSQFNGGFAFGAGPVEVGGLVGESISFSSSSTNAVIGNSGYGLGNNGSWDSGRNGYIGLNNTSAPGEWTQFVFHGGPVSSVGGFVNYCILGDAGQCDPAQEFIIQALGLGDVVLETYNISLLSPILTPGALNDGTFFGISRASADIYTFRLYNAVHVLDDLTFTRSNAVPAPAALLLLLGGAAMLLGIRRR